MCFFDPSLGNNDVVDQLNEVIVVGWWDYSVLIQLPKLSIVHLTPQTHFVLFCSHLIYEKVWLFKVIDDLTCFNK